VVASAAVTEAAEREKAAEAYVEVEEERLSWEAAPYCLRPSFWEKNVFQKKILLWET
jgi:hypothetical protein